MKMYELMDYVIQKLDIEAGFGLNYFFLFDDIDLASTVYALSSIINGRLKGEFSNFEFPKGNYYSSNLCGKAKSEIIKSVVQNYGWTILCWEHPVDYTNSTIDYLLKNYERYPNDVDYEQEYNYAYKATVDGYYCLIDECGFDYDDTSEKFKEFCRKKLSEHFGFDLSSELTKYIVELEEGFFITELSIISIPKDKFNLLGRNFSYLHYWNSFNWINFSELFYDNRNYYLVFKTYWVDDTENRISDEVGFDYFNLAALDLLNPNYYELPY